MDCTRKVTKVGGCQRLDKKRRTRTIRKSHEAVPQEEQTERSETEGATRERMPPGHATESKSIGNENLTVILAPTG
eukprot:15364893-Ditylum_brightwellii.AAC.2